MTCGRRRWAAPYRIVSQPSAAHRRVAVEVPAELRAIRVLQSLVLDRLPPLRPAEVAVCDHPAGRALYLHLRSRVWEVGLDEQAADHALGFDRNCSLVQ
jgi:hypothetical protein